RLARVLAAVCMGSKDWRCGPFNAPPSPRFIVLSQSRARRGEVIFGLDADQRALSAALRNYAFIEHFPDIARGHCRVRRLERIYGKERIRAEYDFIARQL
ncbi:MAG: hypothetical protein WCA43_18065, partial [Bradyrhizobium sp.]